MSERRDRRCVIDVHWPETAMMERLKKLLRSARLGIRGMHTAARQAARGDGYADPVRNVASSELEVDLWILSRFVLERTVPVIGIHPYPLNEQLLAVAAACRLKPEVVFDWGTHHGASARLFWESAKAFGLGYSIHSVDLPSNVSHVENPGDERGRLVRGLSEVHLHLGDGVSVALEQWQRLSRPRRPLFFIDGDHAYASVLGELSRIFAAVPDASALVHDTFYQSADSGYNVGPAEAIQRIVALDRSRFKVLESGPGLPGMTLLASKAALARSSRPD